MINFYLEKHEIKELISSFIRENIPETLEEEFSINIYDNDYYQAKKDEVLNVKDMKLLLLNSRELNQVKANEIELFDDIIFINKKNNIWLEKLKSIILEFCKQSIHTAQGTLDLLLRIFNQLPIGIFVKDCEKDFQYIFWNKFLEKKLNISAENVIGKNDFDLFDDESSKYHFDMEKNILESGEPKDIFTVENQGENKLYAHTIKFPLYNINGIPQAIVGFIEDVTELKKSQIKIKEHVKSLENANAQLEKLNIEHSENEAKLKEVNEGRDKIFSIIAHDLKNPFITFMGFLDVLLNDFDDLNDDEKLFYLNEMDKVAKESYTLLNNLLKWSQSKTGGLTPNPERIVLRELVDNVFSLIKPVASGKKINLISELKNGLSCYADFDMTTTIVRNLLSNAIKFTDEGGNLVISAKPINDFVEMTVSDDGIGIEEERIDNIFEFNPNRSTMGTKNEKGTGLGLVLSREFIEKNGGKIWVESEAGKGSDFKFILPRV